MCYSSKLLETTFVEVNKKNKSNIVIGCIYQCNGCIRINSLFLTSLLNKTNFEKKTLILMGDFNIDLLKIDNDPQITSFLDIHNGI